MNQPLRNAAQRIQDVLSHASLDEIRYKLRNLVVELREQEPMAPAPAQGTPEPPKVEEIAKQIAMECYEHMHITPTQEIGIMKHAETAMRPYFPPASQTPQSLDFHTWLTRVHGFKVGSARNSYKEADLEAAWNAGISHRPEVIGAKPLCLDCHGAGIINCSHFDNCRGKWVYVATPASTARTDGTGMTSEKLCEIGRMISNAVNPETEAIRLLGHLCQ